MIPAQIDRFGRLGDGIVTTYLTDDDCRRLRELGNEALARHGRSLPRFPLCVYTTVRIEDDPARAETLTRMIDRLRHDPAYIEKLAREEHGFVREGESVLKFPPKAK